MDVLKNRLLKIVWLVSAVLLCSCDESLEEVAAPEKASKPISLDKGPGEDPGGEGPDEGTESFITAVPSSSGVTIRGIMTMTASVNEWITNWNNTNSGNDLSNNPDVATASFHIDIRYLGSGDEPAWDNGYSTEPDDSNSNSAGEYLTHDFYYNLHRNTFIASRVKPDKAVGESYNEFEFTFPFSGSGTLPSITDDEDNGYYIYWGSYISSYSGSANYPDFPGGYPNFKDGFYEVAFVNWAEMKDGNLTRSETVHDAETTTFVKGEPKPYPPGNPNVSVSGSSASFSWQKAVGAESYRVSITKSGSPPLVINTTGTTTSASLANGNYSWSVASVSAADKLNTVNGSSFSIDVSVPVDPPVTANLSGPTTLDTGQTGNYSVSGQSGGTGTYSYEWSYRHGFSGSWMTVPNQTSSFSKVMPASNIEVRVKITSGTDHIYKTKRTYWEDGGNGA